MKTAEHLILTRIGFAERWLQRAREECLDGDVGRGLLTLVLADAEVRRVLQLAVPPAPRSRSRLLPVVAVGAGLVAAVALVLQLGMLALGGAPVESAGLAPGLLLRPGTGALLEPVKVIASHGSVRVTDVQTLPVPARPAPARRSPSRRTTGSGLPVPAQPAATPVVPVTVPPAPSPAPAAGPQTTAAAPVPALAPAPATEELSGVDLLDLVIVADRTLRRSQP